MKYYKQEKHAVTAYMTMASYVMLTQMSANAGIKKIGEQAIAEIFKGFK